MSQLDDLASDAETTAYRALQVLRTEGYTDGYIRALQEVERHLPSPEAGNMAVADQVANVRGWIDRTMRGAGVGRPFGTLPHPSEPTRGQVAAALRAYHATDGIHADKLEAAIRVAIHGTNG